MTGATITGSVTIGVTLGTGGYGTPLTITNTGTIHPTTITPGLYAGYAGGSVFNNGTIIGGAGYGFTPAGDGISLAAGDINNDGLIDGGAGRYGVGTIGAFYGGAGAAVSGGTFTTAGTLNGGYGEAGGGAGLTLSNGTVFNSGEIKGGKGGVATDTGLSGLEGAAGKAGYGVVLSNGVLINTGSITGGTPGTGALGYGYGGDAVEQRGGTLENSGVIIGGLQPTRFGGFYQYYVAGNGIDLFGGLFINSGTVIGPSDRSLGGYGVIFGGGTLIDSGTIVGGLKTNVSPGLAPAQRDAVAFVGTNATHFTIDPGAAFNGDVVGRGDDGITLGTGAPGISGSLTMGGSFSGFDTIAFNPGASWYLSGTTAELAANETIIGLTTLDKLLVETFAATSKTYITGTGLILSDGTSTATLDITGNFDTASFQIVDETTGTEILLCFLRGTKILGPAREVAVEDLNIGDPVITRFHGYRRIKWIGRQSFAARFIRNNSDRLPIRIHAGALGGGLPKRDLFVSPGHSMLIGNILVLAKSLVNGITITQDNVDQDIHYYLLEFETHDCVLAEGSWSESYADAPGLRNQFQNAAEFHALYPNHTPLDDLKLCAPRPESGRLLEAALRPITAAATQPPGPLRGSIDQVRPDGFIEGWAQDTASPFLPVLLDITLHNKTLATILACDYRSDLAAAGVGTGHCAFAITLPPIPIAERPQLRIRRASDGAEIFQTDDCVSRAA